MKGTPSKKGEAGLTANAATSTVSGVEGGVTNQPKEHVVLTPEQRDANKMRELLDEGNTREALRMARRLATSDDTDVRMRVVTVFGWIGVTALTDLSRMLADPDEQVAAFALSQWKLAYEEISDEATKADLLVCAMNVVKSAEEMESMAMSFSQLREDVAVKSLVQVIQGDNAVAGEVARQHYEFITQNPYTTAEAAQQWIKESAKRGTEPSQ